MSRKIAVIFFLFVSLFISNVMLFAGSDMQSSDLEDEFSYSEEIVADPLEPYNRVITSFNDSLYFILLDPTAKGYAAVVPRGSRLGIRNFFHNIMFPIRFVNNILQLKFAKAGIETARFIINSTMGIAGFLDPAKSCFCMESYDEDFGQTLGFYKMGSIFHIDWPFIGPSNLRDSIGYVGDFFLNPINYIFPNMWIVTGIHVFEKINHVSLHLGEYEKLKKESVDYYLQIRDSYEQFREKEIKE
jgi:phospholipid-binding lipoprotein MlaA